MAAAFEGTLAIQIKGESIVRFAIIAPVALFVVAGCATITTGQNQSISVTTPGCQAASCELRNDKGNWYVSSTPGTVTVQRAYGDMTVTCEKGEFRSNPMAVASATKAMAFGNILVGGLIGAAVDAGTGSAYDYPALINVPMICVGDPKTVVQPSTTPSQPTTATAGAATPGASAPSAVSPSPQGSYPSVPASAVVPVSAVSTTTPSTAPSVTSGAPEPASAVPVAKAPPLPASGSKHMFAAERFAKGAGCVQPIASLGAQTPAFESFTVICANGDPMIIRCDGGACRELK